MAALNSALVRAKALVLILSGWIFAAGLEEIGRLDTKDGILGAEIVAYAPEEKILLVASGEKSLTVVSLENASAPKILEMLKFRGDVPSVSVSGNFVAVIEMNVPASGPGFVHLYEIQNQKLNLKRSFRTGAHPDMLAFSPDGKSILVACEGEADKAGDPVGTIGWVELRAGLESADPHELDFAKFDSTSLAKSGVRLGGPGNYLQNIEPEYVAICPDGKTAFATLQENNAVAKIDVEHGTIENVFGLGSVDHALPGNEFDFRDDGRISLEHAPVRGELQPDGIACFEKNGKTYFLTADEGADRDFENYSDVTSAKTLRAQGKLDREIFSDSLVQGLGRLPIDAVNPCDGNEPCRYLNTFGGRSMSLFSSDGVRIWNSGSALEKILSEKYPELFNRNAKKKKIKPDARSDKKGPEPEGVTVGETSNGTFAFLGMERASGIAVFDLKNPEKPQLLDYFVNAQDRGPEGILFIRAGDSPQPGFPLLVVGYEYSRSLVIYRINY